MTDLFSKQPGNLHTYSGLRREGEKLTGAGQQAAVKADESCVKLGILHSL